MQENVKFITIRTENAINSVQDLKNYIKDLQDVLVNTEKDTEEYNATIEKLVVSQEKLNDVMAATKKNADAAEGSYNSLVNKMSALKTAWRATTSEVQRAQLGDKINEINEQLKAYDATIGNHQRKVGSYEQALAVLTKEFSSQKQELSALKTALDNLEPGTDAYNQAFERATQITHDLSERQEMLRMSANDLGTQLGNVASIGAGLVGGLNSINAIMTLTGSKNEDLTKAMVKLQAGIALVQGMKGIEGAVKSLKGYANWAAKAYDNIVKMITGQKQQQKQIQATTNATEANAAANNQVAASEVSAAAGANTLGAGMRNAAAGTTTATAAMTAFKAVLMSLGIGIVIAAVSALVTMLGKLAGSWLNAGDTARQNAYDVTNYIDKAQQKLLEREEERFEREIEMAKANGETQLQILERYKEFYENVFQGFVTAEGQAFDGISHDMEVAKANLEIFKSFEGDTKRMRKSDKKAYERDINKWIAEIKIMKENGNMALDEVELNHKKTFDRILENGVKTYGDMYKVLEWYYKGAAELAENYQFNPMGGNENDIQVEITNILTEAKNANKSEIQLENESYKTRKELLEKYGKDTTDLTKAHNKKVYEIITGATQSILDSAKAANQTELQQLETKYQKELRILKQYGRDTTELTKAYEKQKEQIIYKTEIKALENTIKFREEVVAEYKQTYDKLNAMGVDRAADAEKIQKQEHDITKKNLKDNLDEWTKLYNKYYEDEKLTEEQRLEIKEKYVNAQKALQKEETDYLLKQIKTRKQAIDEEIGDIEKRYNGVSNMQSLNTEYKYSQHSGFGDTFWGGRQNASYNQMREDTNAAYNIDKARLEEEIAAYQEYADKIAKTDAERTYAQQKMAEKRMELSTLERENLLDNLKLEIDEQKELISTIVDVGNSIGDILGSVADAWEDSIQAQVNAGKMSQEEADKQMENVRALQIVQATINMLAGSFGAFAQASETIPPPYGQIVGAAAAAAVIAQGIAQIAAIKNAGKGGSSGGSVQMAQVTPVMTDYQPQMVGNATGEQETEQLANAIQGMNLWVSVTDIDSAQEKGKVRVSESTY